MRQGRECAKVQLQAVLLFSFSALVFVRCVSRCRVLCCMLVLQVWSPAAIIQAHTLLFTIAAVHILYTTSVMVLCIWKVCGSYVPYGMCVCACDGMRFCWWELLY